MEQPIDDLLGAFALDAVDDDERRRVDGHLAADPRAAAEVAAHREAAAMLTAGAAPAPPALWDRIAAALDSVPPEPGPRLAGVLPRAGGRWRARALVGASLAVAAAATVVAVVATRDDARVRPSTGAVEQAYGEAWADPAGRRAHLASIDGGLVADAVVTPSGVGYLEGNRLPALAVADTYQLWGVYADGDIISLGVLGHRPAIEPFTATGDVDAFVITQERAGGVVASANAPLLTGNLN